MATIPSKVLLADNQRRSCARLASRSAAVGVDDLPDPVGKAAQRAGVDRTPDVEHDLFDLGDCRPLIGLSGASLHESGGTCDGSRVLDGDLAITERRVRGRKRGRQVAGGSDQVRGRAGRQTGVVPQPRRGRAAGGVAVRHRVHRPSRVGGAPTRAADRWRREKHDDIVGESTYARRMPSTSSSRRFSMASTSVRRRELRARGAAAALTKWPR